GFTLCALLIQKKVYRLHSIFDERPSLLVASKIGFNRKPELLNKYFLENADVVLLVKDQHRLFVFNGIYRPKGNRTVLIGDQNGIADYPCSPFVAIIECLDVRQQH